jgi:hypothetical protein
MARLIAGRIASHKDLKQAIKGRLIEASNAGYIEFCRTRRHGRLHSSAQPEIC